MLFEEWRKFKGWEVLEFFLRTNEEIHTKELSRRLKISPLTATHYLKLYTKADILERRRKANLVLYSMKDNALTRQLKVFYIVERMYQNILKFAKKNNPASIVLYGSHASGTYDGSSDIDLMVISQQRPIEISELRKIEKKTGKEVKVQSMSIGEWRRMKRSGSPFAKSVLSNHIVLYGAGI